MFGPTSGQLASDLVCFAGSYSPSPCQMAGLVSGVYSEYFPMPQWPEKLVVFVGPSGAHSGIWGQVMGWQKSLSAGIAVVLARIFAGACRFYHALF